MWMSKHLAQCCNDDRQDVHDAHGQERDSDHYQPRENELIHVLGPAVLSHFTPFAFQSFRICFVVAQERSRATGPPRAKL